MIAISRACVLAVTISGVLAGLVIAPSAKAAAQSKTTLENAVDAYSDECVAPFFEYADPSATVKQMAAPDIARPLLARLAKGAPAEWRGLSDVSIGVERRIEDALGLLATKVSQGSADEQQIAKAYTAYYLPIPQTESCRRPAGLREYVETHGFWALSSQTP